MQHPLKPRILCIDDEANVGAFLKHLLERTGDFVVAVETKAVAAVERARLFRPDLLITDIRMPGPDGFALARDLRKEPALRHKPILFFSGASNMEESVEKIWRTGPAELLEKGVPNAVIEQTVRRILSERITQYHASKSGARGRAMLTSRAA